MKNATETFNEMKHRIENNVVIWNSNDRHPMDDLMTEWLDLDLVTQEMLNVSVAFFIFFSNFFGGAVSPISFPLSSVQRLVLVLLL